MDEERKRTQFTEFMYRYMRDVEDRLNERKNISWFARRLGISQSSLSNYLSGAQEPDERTTDKLAKQTGPEIYDVLGRARPMPPDPRLQLIAHLWAHLEEEDREKLVHDVERKAKEHGPKPVNSL